MTATEHSAKSTSATPVNRPAGGRTRGFWTFVAIACGLQLLGWIAWFVVTRNQAVEEVPLATVGER